MVSLSFLKWSNSYSCIKFTEFLQIIRKIKFKIFHHTTVHTYMTNIFSLLQEIRKCVTQGLGKHSLKQSIWQWRSNFTGTMIKADWFWNWAVFWLFFSFYAVDNSCTGKTDLSEKPSPDEKKKIILFLVFSNVLFKSFFFFYFTKHFVLLFNTSKLFEQQRTFALLFL